MRRLAIILLLLSWAIPARAQKIIQADDWASYGAATGLPSPSPYTGPSGEDTTSTVQISTIIGPPWNPGGSSYILTLTPLSIIANPGVGVYRQTGNVYQALAEGFWYRVRTLPVTSAAFWRINDSQFNHLSEVPPQGVDQTYLSIDSSGNVTVLNAGNTSIVACGTPLSLNTWYMFWLYVYIGDTGGSSPRNGVFDMNIYSSSGSLVENCVNSSTAQTRWTGNGGYNIDGYTFDAEFDNQLVEDFGPFVIVDPQGKSASTILSTYDTPLYVQNLAVPTANSTPIQFTPSTGTNYSNVNSVPPGAAYNYAATTGYEDVYSIGSNPTPPNILAVSVQSVVESDAAGARVFTHLVNNGSLVGANDHSVSQGNANFYPQPSPGTYNWFQDVYNQSTIPTAIGFDLVW